MPCYDSFTGATPTLLQVLQDASVAEVIDVAAEVHKLGVDVCGHAAVGGGGEVGATGHHAGTARWGAFSPPLHQGTKSTRIHRDREEKEKKPQRH